MIKVSVPEIMRAPTKTKDFSVFVVVCTHRDIKVQVNRNIRALESCPSPKFVRRDKDGDALIDRARSIVASTFLREHPDKEILLFIDDDIVFNPLDILKLVHECRESDLGIVGGAYVGKSDANRHFMIKTLDRKPLIFGKGGGIYEVRMVSTGCMAIHRSVLEKMAKTLPLCHPDSLKFWPFFQPYPEQIDGKWIYLSEDWAFCDRAKKLGFKIYVDSTIKLGHIGPSVYDWDDILSHKKEVHESFEYSEALG